MDRFVTHTGTAVPLRRTSVDTDQIVPSSYLKLTTRTGYQDGLFREWRTDPDFVLNRPEHRGASVLVAGPGFGTGSSREHAVWALLDYGFRVVVSSSFADIFRGNAGQSGLLAARMEQSEVETLWTLVEREPATELTVDLHTREIRAGELTLPFEIDDYTRWRLLEGLDDIAVTLGRLDEIAAFERTRPRWMPTVTVAPEIDRRRTT